MDDITKNLKRRLKHSMFLVRNGEDGSLYLQKVSTDEELKYLAENVKNIQALDIIKEAIYTKKILDRKMKETMG